jgi:hypothetical protein
MHCSNLFILKTKILNLKMCGGLFFIAYNYYMYFQFITI